MQHLIIKGKTVSIVIQSGDAFRIETNLPVDDFDVTQEGETVSIKQIKNSSSYTKFNCLFSIRKMPKLVVTVPNKQLYTVTAECLNGKLKAENIHAYEINMTTTNGSTNIVGGRVNTAILRCINGSTVIDGAHVEREAIVQTSNGFSVVKHCITPQAGYEISCVNGKIALSPEIDSKDSYYREGLPMFHVSCTNGKVKVE